jgi:hypothetical protein
VLTTLPYAQPRTDTDPANTSTSWALRRPTSPTLLLSISAPPRGSLLDDIADEDDEAGYEEEPEANAAGRPTYALSGEVA